MDEKIFYDPENVEVTEENDQISEESSEEVTTQQIIVEIQTTEDLDIEYHTSTDAPYVDTRLYMSAPVSGADNNDIFSMLLSIRNILLLFMLLFVFFKLKQIIHTVISKLLRKEK